MIVEKALKIAGPGSLLASRPHGVTHVVLSTPLTPSGRYLPRSARPVCRARTRRLSVVTTPQSWSSLAGSAPRLCTRCSTCLARRRTFSHPGGGLPVRQVEQHPLTRDQYRAAYAGTTLADLWFAGHLATDVDELATVGHLSLVLHGPACHRPTPLPGGRTAHPVHQVISDRRRVLAPDTWLKEAAAPFRRKATEHRKADLKAAHELAEAQRRAPRVEPTHRSGAPL